MYARSLAGRRFTFDFGAGLVNNNLLLVDRQTSSVWSQLANRAISGAMTGTPLRPVPAMQTTWKFWRARHPDTRVMIEPGDASGRPYFYHHFVPGGPRGKRPGAHDASTLGLGYSNGSWAVYFSFTELARAKIPVRATLGQAHIIVHYDKKGLTAWATDSTGKLLATVLVYADSWRRFFPKTRIFRADVARSHSGD